MEITIEKIPEYMLPYFVNGDTEGYEEEEIATAEKWMAESGVKDVICPTQEEYKPYFTHYPAFGLPVEVVDCKCVLEW